MVDNIQEIQKLYKDKEQKKKNRWDISNYILI